MMLLDTNVFPYVLQESYFNFDGKDYLFFPDEKVEFYSLNYHNRKIQSFQELVYTMEVLYHLNPDMEWEQLLEAANWVSDRGNGKIVRTYGEVRVKEAVSRIFDNPRKPYVNQYRRVVFNPSRTMTKEKKMSLVGELCGGSRKRTTQQEIYDIIEEYMAEEMRITINDIADAIGLTRQTISKHLTEDMKEIMREHNESLK